MTALPVAASTTNLVEERVREEGWRVRTRRYTGTALLAIGGTVLAALAAGAWYSERVASGEAEASANLAILVRYVEDAYVRDGKLCPSSLLDDSDPFTYRTWSTAHRHESEAEAQEKREGAGFHCLGVDPRKLEPGNDMFSYEVGPSGKTFTLRAFRAYLYDSQGKLPRFERRGEVRPDGRLRIDPRLHRVAPGGPRFLGHPDQSNGGH